MEPERKNLVTTLLIWVLRYASYGALSIVAMVCTATLLMAWMSITNNPDMTYISNLSFLNEKLSNPDNIDDMSMYELMDVFMFFITIITVPTIKFTVFNFFSPGLYGLTL